MRNFERQLALVRALSLSSKEPAPVRIASRPGSVRRERGGSLTALSRPWRCCRPERIRAKR